MISKLRSGNGYHIYIPIESRYILEGRQEFSKFKESSKQFLRFAEWHVSGGKADPNHFRSVSFGNCMLRIPGSHNSRCVQRNGVVDSASQIKVVNEWNGIRAPFCSLVGSFLAYLVDQDIQRRKTEFSKYAHDHNNESSGIIQQWLERCVISSL